MHRFYVENNQIQDGNITLTGEDVNHIKNVLRMKTGEKAVLCNGEGKDYYCSILDIQSNRVVFSVEEEKNTDTELGGKIYLFQGLPKKDKMELIIQKAVELGVYEIIPVMTGRTVVKLEDSKKEQKKLERWQAISVSAAKQSGRGIIPRITGVYSFRKALDYAKDLDMKLMPYENEKGMPFTRETLDKIKQTDNVGVFIGPEGGFEEKEVEEAGLNGFIPITLGKRILRTETAGLTALSLLMMKMESDERD
ncbi:16S rRNA (uracil(1498)-N(3))-methyltransferase [Anaerocolumna xylanovorans]|uniref:Ribosomal RNA small subunit methyltransferase E n=1 Tax=Anaerocolumna xylanovorans DSM 12503 TaxID=1121345 RepID=A0A1M7YMW2_9FIRM|nr:16S rRNA (uracil(1498)-N(3))-methyltransferase [Anaerocolumna xylanovorans]SHO53993.1 16S rRNA (uracil1498-N3)-methyltransferase [Anaerocolumna xylanovorans DSM 12503]